MSWPRDTLSAAVIVVALVAAACAQHDPVVDSGRLLTSHEITTLFADHTVTGNHELRGYSFRSYYDPSGTFRSYQSGAPEPRIGDWNVTPSDDICIRWHDTGERFCRAIVTDDAGQYRKVRIDSSGRRELIVTFSSFTPGNPDRL